MFVALHGTHVQVRVNNYGYAMHTQHVKTDRAVIITPSVTSITPVSGSTQGGQLITVTGSNLCFECSDCSGGGRRRRRSALQDAMSLDGVSTTHNAVSVSLCETIDFECELTLSDDNACAVADQTDICLFDAQFYLAGARFLSI